MQELEKILEEIDQEKKNALLSIEHTTGYKAGQIRMAERIEEIIHKNLSHENDSEITRLSRDNDSWISVEERRPEVDAKNKTTECVLVTDGIFIWMAYYVPDCWIFADCSNTSIKIDWSDIIAWRPLPEPYHAERSRE